MNNADAKYQVHIHGNIYGLAIGDHATASINRSSQRQYPSPFLTPTLPPQGVLGRDEELTCIFDLLALNNGEVQNVAPVALRGMGGIGKTTLAIALGRLDLIPRLFSDGVLWAALGPDPAVRLLLDDWGRSLGVDLLPEPDEVACSRCLREALYHRRVLLIVDDVWEVTHGKHFLVAGPQCRTLITTRESPVAYTLTTRERTLPVNVLKPDAALELLRSLAPEVVTDDDTTALRLCERLEYLPLALTLAGRLLAIETDVPSRMQRVLGELIEHREARLQLLQQEGRPGLDEDRPVSLQAILGMSVSRLNQIDQERFSMLSVFGSEPLTWEINAAAFVWECSVEETEASVSTFIQRGLVTRRGNRYWMHALLADYAAKLLEELDW